MEKQKGTRGRRTELIDNSTLKKRIITVLWGVPLLAAAVWFDKPLPWFGIFVAIWGVLAVHEFYRLVATSKVPPLTYFGLIWTLLFILSPHFDHDVITPLLLTSAVILPLIWLMLRPKKTEVFTVWIWTIAGVLYVGWLLSYLVALRGLDNPQTVLLDEGRNWLFFVIFTTFASDSAAFFVGRAWGKHHLAPSVSPSKTWEGTIAGISGAIIASLVLTSLLSLPLGYGQAILLGLMVSVFGQLGDLIESLFKRNMGVKDSGKLIPGHGGFLDRMDSIVFAGIVVYYYVIWVVQ
ncbi:phosphatidate cytidylyltransferase [Chloroflexota bacterium]